MKKKIRRLRLERDTIRNLTPDRLEAVAGGSNDVNDSRHNSCDTLLNTRPCSICNSCFNFPFICG